MTRDEKLEHEVLKMCLRVGLGNPQKTKASGQTRGDGDITTDNFMFECKYKSTKSLSLSLKDIDKAAFQALKQNKIPVMVRENEEGSIMVSMKMSDWERLLSILEQTKGLDLF